MCNTGTVPVQVARVLAKRHHKFLNPRGCDPGWAVSSAPRGALAALLAAGELRRNARMHLKRSEVSV